MSLTFNHLDFHGKDEADRGATCGNVHMIVDKYNIFRCSQWPVWSWIYVLWCLCPPHSPSESLSVLSSPLTLSSIFPSFYFYKSYLSHSISLFIYFTSFCPFNASYIVKKYIPACWCFTSCKNYVCFSTKYFYPLRNRSLWA